MNYHRIYEALVLNANTRILSDVYTENHHIIPRCMGGNDTKENLVALTAREHFIAHALLVKMYKDTEYVHKLVYAFNFMKCDGQRGGRANNRTYSLGRDWFKKFHPMKSDDTKQKMIGSLNRYYEETKEIREIEKKNRREYVYCACGCGNMFEKMKNAKPNEGKMFFSKSCGANYTWNNPEVLEKQSIRAKKQISSLTKEQLRERMKNSVGTADPVLRGRAISLGKKGKKTNQLHIMGTRYASMTDEEFAKYLTTLSYKATITRAINLRNKYLTNANDT